MALITLFVFLFAWSATVWGITVTTATSSYTINTESTYGFTTTISRTSCDITSLNFYGTEYQYGSTYSSIASGLGTATVSYTTSGKCGRGKVTPGIQLMKPLG
jgi:rhamnogalacturonan endolyase